MYSGVKVLLKLIQSEEYLPRTNMDHAPRDRSKASKSRVVGVRNEGLIAEALKVELLPKFF